MITFDCPPETIYAIPRITSCVASVTTNGNRSNLATKMPFIKPNIEHMTIAAKIANGIEFVAISVSPTTTLVSANIEPMDKSIPPAVMTNTIPNAKMQFVETC